MFKCCCFPNQSIKVTINLYISSNPRLTDSNGGRGPALQIHVPLPRLRPDHIPDAPVRGIKHLLVKVCRNLHSLQRILRLRPVFRARSVGAHGELRGGNDTFAAFAAVALRTWGAEAVHGVDLLFADGVEALVEVVGPGVVFPGSDVRVAGEGRGAAVGLRGDEGGRGAEDGFEAGVNVGFDVDGVIGGLGVDEGHKDVECDAEHGFAGAAEIGGGVTGGSEGGTALLGEGEHSGQENDVFAVELHGAGVSLESFGFQAVGHKTFVEGFHGEHLPTSLGMRRTGLHGSRALGIGVLEGV